MKSSIYAGISILLFGIPSIGLAQDLPLFIQELIAEHEAASRRPPVPTPLIGNFENKPQFRQPTREIWQLEYDGETVFFLPILPTHCCHTLSWLYDADGNLICFPDGGITGEGDGRCPGFRGGPGRGVLVYRGPRSEEPSAEDSDADTEAR